MTVFDGRYLQYAAHAGRIPMTHSTKTARIAALSLALAALLSACNNAGTAPSATSSAQEPERTKEQMIELGRQQKTAWQLYQSLREKTKGGQSLASSNLPDWSGVYTRAPVPGFAFDPDQGNDRKVSSDNQNFAELACLSHFDAGGKNRASPLFTR